MAADAAHQRGRAAGLLLELLLLLLVAPVEVAAQRAHHDHRDDACQQQHDRPWVEDREPVDLVVAMYRYRSQRDAHLMSDSSHETSYVKMYSPASEIGCGGRSGLSGTLVSFASLVPHVPLYVCFTEKASTSKPTIRAPVKVAGSLWYFTMKRRWLLM